VAGLYVIATARNKDVLKDLEGMGMSTLSLDVTNPEDVENARKEVEVLTSGKLDILVNNA
jgi:1-acylglycerone phosphate reductase